MYQIIAENEKEDKITIKNVNFSQISFELKMLNYKYKDIKKITIVKEN